MRLPNGLIAKAAWLVVLVAAAAPSRAQEPRRYNGHPGSSEVMLQGFHWTAYVPAQNGNKPWYQIVRENAETIKGAGFDYVWFPPPSASAAGDNAYLPTEWFRLENGYGTEGQLRQTIDALRPTVALCDMVLNHRCGTATAGADFTNPAFDDNAAAVVKGDECECGTGHEEEHHRDGSVAEGNRGGRDLDHANPSVQSRVKEFQTKLKGLGFGGWRYDDVLGYNGQYVGEYNDASDPVLSVGEYWVGDAQRVIDWIDETGGKSMAFDFSTRDALVGATLGQNYAGLKTADGKPPGAIRLWPEMCVTFIENHDTEPVRDSGNKRFPDDKVMQGYVYILTHPGLPCVFWRHFFDQGDDQKARLTKLIKLRRDAGITSGSTVWIEPADPEGKYAAVINGSKGRLAMKIGHADWSPQPADKWKVALDGPDYAVWTEVKP